MTQTTPTVKPDRRAARYQKLCATIERWQRRVDKADRIVQRGTRMLIKLERQRRRAQVAMAKVLEPVAPAAEHPRVTATQAAVADSLVVSAAVDAAAPPKPKRQRKAVGQPKPSASELLTDMSIAATKAVRAERLSPKGFAAAVVEKSLSRAARMKAMGFRQTKGK